MTEDDDTQAFSNALFGRPAKSDDAPADLVLHVETSFHVPDVFPHEFFAELFGTPDH